MAAQLTRVPAVAVFCSCTLAGLVFFAPSAHAGRPSIEPTAPLSIVNTYTTGAQREVRIAEDGEDFIVLWTGGGGQDGSGDGVYAQDFTAGIPSGGEFQINSYTTNAQRIVGVHRVLDGTSERMYTVMHDSRGHITFRRYLDGVAVEPAEVQVTGDGGVTATSFVTTRAGLRSLGTCYRRVTFSEAGTELFCSIAVLDEQSDGSSSTPPSEFRINTFTPGSQAEPAACGLPDGEFIVAWTSRNQDASPSSAGSIYAQRADVDGNLLGTEFRVNETANYSDDDPRVCCTDSGFVVAWVSGFGLAPSPDGSGNAIQARRFAGDATPMGTEFVVNEATGGSQVEAAVGCNTAGAFVVAWRNSYDIRARAFAADDTPLTRDSTIANSSGSASDPRITLNTAGRGVLVWQDTEPGLDNFEVKLRPFTVPGLDDAGVCGDPLDRNAGSGLSTPRLISASDALCALQAAVGSTPCQLCVCDVTGDSGITATDALLILQRAVGQAVALNCPACS